VHFFCPSVSFLVEAQPRLKTSENKRHFLAKVHIKFLVDRTTTKQETSSLEELQIYFVSTFFK
jgi:hypothetical protein